MIDYGKHAIILAIIEGLHRHGSWTGKTHVQKALSFLRDKAVVEVPFHFVLYHHGPYSFDLEDELEQMRSYDAIKIESNEEGYGVVLHPGPMAGFVKKQKKLNLKEKKAIEDVCSFVGARNTMELERLATASWIRCQEKVTDPKKASQRLHLLKPHISPADAMRAFQTATVWLDKAHLGRIQ